MARCDRTDCGRGEIDDQGFCTACDRRPLRAPQAGRGAQVRADPWWGLNLVESGAIPDATDEPVRTGTIVAEENRFCARCQQPAGRGDGDQPARLQGFCANCGQRFDFGGSGPGQVVADRYEVRRKLGAGSFGAALLAYDRNLGTDVVLKDLTQSVAQTARQERDALVGLRHDSIVRIYGYEPEGPYLVLEYVRGTPLSVRADDRVEVILGHGLQILQALDYLHARGLLHIDVKPENIIRFGEQGAGGPRDRVRLIDFGAVWKMGRPGPVTSYTVAYAPPKADPDDPDYEQKTDPEHRFPTAGFDLFCLGVTLRMLCRRHLPDLDKPGIRALDRLLKRATDVTEPARRFVSARQFAEQLSGVIRQVVAANPVPRRISRPSEVFGSMTEPRHGGLGAPRPFGDWIAGRVTPDGKLAMAAPFEAPSAADAVRALPAPLSDPDDPAMTRGCEGRLMECRTALRHGDLDDADGALAETRLPGWTWIRAWYSGLIALARGDAGTAAGHFTDVRDALPGDLIPLLALGFCAEISGDLAEADRRYRAVADTAPALGAAGFGLARVRLLAGQRAEAVAAAERLATELRARELRFEPEARIAVVRLLAAVTESSVPAEADLGRALTLLDALKVGPGARIALRTEIRYGMSCLDGDWLALSEMLHELAKLAVTRADFFDMIDLAHELRPPVEWWWQRGFRRVRDRAAVST
ncbi:MAG TPA: tetratricopeptide repeat protein [Streptosporangiaceae bacterium]|nr:tetratricopeptide repeat protein [Streptosporangiaceae bacterium]